MNIAFQTPRRRLFLAATLAAGVACAQAAPGAHGPNGEHLDQKSGSVTATALPKLEAKSEQFELVATLTGSTLSILVDRYETNEPVLNARLEVESGSLKAVATFHEDHGGYAVTDPALLKALSTPGEHALVFTLVAGKDTDLLDGTLVTTQAAAGAHSHDDENDHDHRAERAAWLGAAAVGAGLVSVVAWRRLRRGNGAPEGKAERA
jgi:hypothetical protein